MMPFRITSDISKTLFLFISVTVITLKEKILCRGMPNITLMTWHTRTISIRDTVTAMDI